MKKPSSHSTLSTFLIGLTGAFAMSELAGGCAAKSTKHRYPQFVDDETISTQVRDSLAADAKVKAFEIKVQTVKGVVQLSGLVDTAVQKAAAEMDAALVRGVETVENDLIVK